MDETLASRMDRAFLVFFIVFVLWHLAAYLLLYRRRSAAFRRVWHPRSAFLSGSLFVGFVAHIVSQGFPANALFVFVPAAVVFTAINIRNTRFCDACGKQNFSMNPFNPPDVCRRC